MSVKTYVPDDLIALIEYALGDAEHGRASLKKSIDAHCGMLLRLKTTPLLDQIAADPKGVELYPEDRRGIGGRGPGLLRHTESNPTTGRAHKGNPYTARRHMKSRV
jgi:hypothetical protein